MITVLAPGLCTMVVDRQGRPRTRSLGVPLGGAADRFSLAVGNALVGNHPPGTAALEVTLAGPTLITDAPLACVLYGAPFEMHLDGRSVKAGATFTWQPGEKLAIGGTAEKVRAYLCVRGGVEAATILGSRSGLAPLKAGETICCPRRLESCRVESSRWIIGRLEEEDEDLSPLLRVVPGPQAEWFPPAVLRGRSFEVTLASNRMGLRLRGDPPLPVPAREMVSEPVCPGTVQVTRDGQCIVLGVDGQTIGGYPRVAQVIGADLDRLGQLRPGRVIGMEYVSLDEAERLAEQRAARLRRWLAGLG